MQTFDKVNIANGFNVLHVTDDNFKTFGRVVEGIDVKALNLVMEKTEIPSEGNVYVGSFVELEKVDVKTQIQEEVYGGLEIQLGYCNGRNSTINGFEYHKCSEVLYAVTDLVLCLAHTYDMKNNTIESSEAKFFFVPKGCLVEIYQTSLHLSPCKVSDEGFKAVIILLKGTNDTSFARPNTKTQEGEILLFKNKWVITHKDREPLVKQGARIGLLGENTEVKF